MLDPLAKTTDHNFCVSESEQAGSGGCISEAVNGCEGGCVLGDTEVCDQRYVQDPGIETGGAC